MGINQRNAITMSDKEIADFIGHSRIATLGTLSANGSIHQVAMWYAVLNNNEIWLETKAKSQKAVNMRRNTHCSISIEAGHTYDQLRGVAIDGRAEIVDDADKLFAIGVSVWERYTGPYTPELKPFVEQMIQKRIAIRIHVNRIRSWDHRKLEMPAIPLGETTAEFL